EMSGGLDSTSVAATALGLIPGGAASLSAHCISHARLFEDHEKKYADIAARTFGIAIDHVIADDFPLFGSEAQWPPRPSPVYLGPLLGPWMAMASRMTTHSRVVLTGWDGDTFMSEYPAPYFRFLLQTRKFGELVRAMGWYAKSQRRAPPVGLR